MRSSEWAREREKMWRGRALKASERPGEMSAHAYTVAMDRAEEAGVIAAYLEEQERHAGQP